MPIYEYVCQACGNEIEVLHGLNEAGPGACHICGGPMRKRLAPPAIVFRGSGWAKKERREAVSSRSTDKSAAKEDADGVAAKGEKGESRAATSAGESAGSGKRESGEGESKSRGAPTKEARAG